MTEHVRAFAGDKALNADEASRVASGLEQLKLPSRPPSSW